MFRATTTTTTTTTTKKSGSSTSDGHRVLLYAYTAVVTAV
jgi:hypothetical protein